VWQLLQEKEYKIRITDVYELKQRLETEWAKLDHIIIAAAFGNWRHR